MSLNCLDLDVQAIDWYRMREVESSPCLIMTLSWESKYDDTRPDRRNVARTVERDRFLFYKALDDEFGLKLVLEMSL